MSKVMNESIRKKVLLCLLAGTLAISILTFIEDKNEYVVEAISTPRPTKFKPQPPSVPTATSQENTARSFYTPSIDIFGDITPAKQEPPPTNVAIKLEESQITTVSIQPQVVISAPPPAPAPPPFKFIGKLYGDDEYIVFLNYNGKNIAVKAGEVLFEKYKVEEITPPTMTLVNLPLSSKETISIGEP